MSLPKGKGLPLDPVVSSLTLPVASDDETTGVESCEEVPEVMPLRLQVPRLP